MPPGESDIALLRKQNAELLREREALKFALRASSEFSDMLLSRAHVLAPSVDVLVRNSAGDIHLVLAAMRARLDDAAVAREGARAIWSFAVASRNQPADQTLRNTVRAVTAAMTWHPSDISVQTEGCAAIYAFAAREADDLVTPAAFSAITRAMETHGLDRNITVICCAAVTKLATSPTLRCGLAAASRHLLPIVTAAMKECVNNLNASVYLCAMLDVLVGIEEVGPGSATRFLDAMSWLLAAMGEHRHSTAIALSGCSAIAEMAGWPGGTEKLLAIGAVARVTGALDRHAYNHDIYRSGRIALDKFASFCADRRLFTVKIPAEETADHLGIFQTGEQGREKRIKRTASSF